MSNKIMKNKICIIALTFIMTLGLVACGADDTSKDEDENQTQEISENVEDEEQKEEVEETEEQEEVSEEDFDDSLEGLDLLKSISGNRPDTVIMKMEMATYGMTTSMTSYYDGGNTRTETVIEGLGTSVSIYNEDDEAMYSYTEIGESKENGIRITGVDMEEAEESGLMVDFNSEFTEISKEVSDEMTVRVEDLDGEEVVYIETTEADEDMGDVLVKMWYSVKYNVPLKYEVISGEQTLILVKVVEIEKDIKIDKSMFEAPTDLDFQDVNLEDMMEMME